MSTPASKSTHSCPDVSPDVAQIPCVLSQIRHPDHHRGVLWVDGVPSDHYWPVVARHRIRGEAVTTGSSGGTHRA